MPDNLTSMHAHRAARGDHESAAWIYERLGPFVRAHAAYRIPSFRLERRITVDDLVQEVWVRTFPKLKSLEPREGRLSHVMRKFLAETLRKVCHEVGRKGRRENVPGRSELWQVISTGEQGPDQNFAARECAERTQEALELMEASERQIVLMKAMEGWTFEAIGNKVGCSKQHAQRRYKAAITALQRELDADLHRDLEARGDADD